MSDAKQPDGKLFVVDSVTEKRARLVAGDNDHVAFTLPVSYLPDGTREGDHLRLRFDKDEASRKETESKVKGLLDELTAGKENDEPEKFQL